MLFMHHSMPGFRPMLQASERGLLSGLGYGRNTYCGANSFNPF